jgi:hypothetical protein
METKRKSGVAVVTENTAQAALRRAPAKVLEPEEEKALRMRLGASLPRSAPLQRVAEGEDLEIELLAYEIEAYMKWRAHQAERAAPTGRAARSPVPSRAKEKIVRALRKKT